MRTRIAEKLNCEVPIFAFTHCRDVVVEVTRAGGFGVLGAASFSPAQLEAELRWIDSHVEGRPYGVDVLIPGRYDKAAVSSGAEVLSLVPAGHKAFVDGLLDEAGLPVLPADEAERVRAELRAREHSVTPEGARELLAVALQHKQISLVVSALSAPPEDMVREFHARGLLVGGMVGAPQHARKHRDVGADIIIAQGTEAGGHTGTISTMVLLPQVVEVAGPGISVLAAGGISRGSQIAAALAMGAEGVWCGTLWLGTRESELSAYEKQALFAARAEDAIQSRSMTGKPARLIRSRWTEMWNQAGAPDCLQPPLQNMLYREARARIDRVRRQDWYSYPAGQVVGALTEEVSVRDVMYRLQAEYVEAMERLTRLGSV